MTEDTYLIRNDKLIDKLTKERDDLSWLIKESKKFKLTVPKSIVRYRDHLTDEIYFHKKLDSSIRIHWGKTK